MVFNIEELEDINSKALFLEPREDFDKAILGYV